MERLFLVLFAGIVAIGGCSGASRPKTQQRGDRIVMALTQYRADHGRYPESLGELSPAYLKDIPHPTWGLREWKYRGQTSEFNLRVDESTRTGDGNSHYLEYVEGYGWQLAD
jgi:hypothetical protein